MILLLLPLLLLLLEFHPNLFKHIHAAEKAECEPPIITILFLGKFFNFVISSVIPLSVQT